MQTMLSRGYTRREHFTAWLLCSSTALLSGLLWVLASKPDGAGEPASTLSIVCAVTVSVAVVSALYYTKLYEMDTLLSVMLIFGTAHALFYIGMTLFVGFIRTMYCYDCGPFALLYKGVYVMASTFWPEFILGTLVTTSLVAYWGWGKSLKLR